MSSEKKSNKSIPMFTRPGYSSPVLRSKAGENVDEFKKRMAKVGWTNLEKVGLHAGPDPSVYHAGSADKCPLCLRQQKRKARIAELAANTAAVASDRAAIKTDSSPEGKAALKELDSAIAESKKVGPKSLSLGAAETLFNIKSADHMDDLVKAAHDAGYIDYVKRKKIVGFKRADSPMKVGKGKRAKTAKVEDVLKNVTTAVVPDVKDAKVEASKGELSTPKTDEKVAPATEPKVSGDSKVVGGDDKVKRKATLA
jgi:hypothetical protein